jgi:hypothetical protein
MFESYKDLPDYMDVNTLKKTFRQFLFLVHTSPNLDIIHALEGLRQLADRQWHTYELLEEKIRKQIDEWASNIWDIRNVELVENLTCIVGYISLIDTYEKIKESLNQELTPEVRIVILECTDENDNGQINDPYVTFKAPKKDG